MIPIEDFESLDIRIGTIINVEEIPDSDKLLKFSVNLGESEIRRIIAGIAPYFENPDALIGRQVPILANLEPRTIRGEMSQGMMLAVGGSRGFTLLVPDEEVPNGSEIK